MKTISCMNLTGAAILFFLGSCVSYAPIGSAKAYTSETDSLWSEQLIPGKSYKLHLEDGSTVKIKVTDVERQWVRGKVKEKPDQIYYWHTVREIEKQKVSPLKTSALIIGLVGVMYGLILWDIDRNGLDIGFSM